VAVLGVSTLLRYGKFVEELSSTNANIKDEDECKIKKRFIFPKMNIIIFNINVDFSCGSIPDS